MAKRKTIRVNPLDTLVPGPATRQTGDSPAAANVHSAGPAAVISQTPPSPNQPKVKASHIPAPTAQVAKLPSAANLSSRVQSLEEQNEYMKWLLGGAILLAIML